MVARRPRHSSKNVDANQSLHDVVRGLSVILDNIDRRAKRVEVQVGESRVSVEFADASAAEIRRGFGVTTTLEDADLEPGDRIPNRPEEDVVGAFRKRIRRNDPEFKTLVSNSNIAIVFKNEELTDADRIMTGRLQTRLDALAGRVGVEWPGVKLRVTEAWDENGEHSPKSLHYEARAADLTTAPPDGAKLGRLARLAVEAGLEWVFFEDSAHIHVSVM